MGGEPLPLKYSVFSTLRTPLDAGGRSLSGSTGHKGFLTLTFPQAPFSPISSPYPTLYFSLAAQSTPEIIHSSLCNALFSANLHHWALGSMQVRRGLCVPCPIPTEPSVWNGQEPTKHLLND